MAAVVALLRPVNVGGTGMLPNTVLADRCWAAGLSEVQTYLASGNAVFVSDQDEAAVRTALTTARYAHTGRSIGILTRSAIELTDVVVRNPFAQVPANRVVTLFVDEALLTRALDGSTGQRDEQVRLGLRESFVWYPSGQATSRLRLPSRETGMARNMNTVTKLAALAGALG